MCKYSGAGCSKHNPVLKFNLLLQFVYFCTSVYFKTSEKKTPIDADKISEEIFPNL